MNPSDRVREYLSVRRAARHVQVSHRPETDGHDADSSEDHAIPHLAVQCPFREQKQRGEACPDKSRSSISREERKAHGCGRSNEQRRILALEVIGQQQEPEKTEQDEHGLRQRPGMNDQDDAGTQNQKRTGRRSPERITRMFPDHETNQKDIGAEQERLQPPRANHRVHPQQPGSGQQSGKERRIMREGNVFSDPERNGQPLAREQIPGRANVNGRVRSVPYTPSGREKKHAASDKRHDQEKDDGFLVFARHPGTIE